MFRAGMPRLLPTIRCHLAPALTALLFCGPAAALDNFFNVTALTLQQGDGFEVGDSRRQIATLEHYSLWNWGDVYFFYDRIREDESGRYAYYGEFSPRLSLAALGMDTSAGPIRDVLLATTVERGSGGFKAHLVGPGLTWKVPVFAHLETNLYYRDTRGLDGETWQFTAAWVLPFATGPLRWQFDGYLDVRGAEGDAASDWNLNPQLKVDVGAAFGLPGHVFAGVEYYHWHNKFGIEGVDERVLSPLLQCRFSL